MKNLFRTIALCIALCILCASLGGCNDAKEETVEEDVLNVYATFYPLYACACMITNGVPRLNLNCLVQPQDGCLRDYQLSDWDYTLLSRSADMIIAGGRGLEAFESDLYNMGDDGPVVACVLYNMEFSENEGTAHISVESESHWLDANPHIYMSIDGMKSIAESICAQMQVVDSANAQLYDHNLEVANRRLNELENAMHGDEATKSASVILANEALTYFAKEFDLNVEYAIDRESGEAMYDTTLQGCIAALLECESRIILIEDQAPAAFVDALAEAGFTVVKIDILSSCDAAKGEQPYFDAQIENADRLKAALNSLSEVNA